MSIVGANQSMVESWVDFNQSIDNCPSPGESWEEFCQKANNGYKSKFHLDIIRSLTADEYRPSLKLGITHKLCEYIDAVLAPAPKIVPPKDCYPKQPKSSSFLISSLKIGHWEHESRNGRDLEGKIFYRTKKLEWQVLNGRRKGKMVIKFDYIDAIEATICDDGTEILQLQLNESPDFHVEVKSEPLKPIKWAKDAIDFTGGQALVFRKHTVTCPPRTLNKYYDDLLRSDSRLQELSKKPFPKENFLMFSAAYERVQASHLNNLGGSQTSFLCSGSMYPAPGNFVGNDNGIRTRNHVQENTIIPSSQDPTIQENLLPGYINGSSQDLRIQDYLVPGYVYGSGAGASNPTERTDLVKSNDLHQ